MFSHLKEIEDKTESDWIALTFLISDNGIVFKQVFFIEEENTS